MGDKTTDLEGISGAVNSVESVNQRSCENSSNSADQRVSETLIVIRADGEEGKEETASVSGQNRNSNAAMSVLEASRGSVGEKKKKKIKDLKDDKHSSVIDVKSGDGNEKLGENLDGERICRICHLSSDPLSSETPPPQTSTIALTTTPTGLIQLGCGCKDELGNVHAYCAEAWFKQKGNRQCEICGETARNITGVGDNRFIEEWNETRSGGSGTSLSERRGGCWRGQPFCNFLMACLVIAFVLPWFFRVNMF